MENIRLYSFNSSIEAADLQRAKVLLEYSQKLKDQHADGDMEVLQDI